MAMDVHVVKRGEVLWQIALESNRTIEQIALCNGISDPNRIEAGQVLRIPPKTVVARCPVGRDKTDYFEYGVIYPKGHRFAGKPHTGVDFHEAAGAHVYAIGPGVLRVHSYDRDGYGWYVLIEHRLPGAPIFSLYGHLERPTQALIHPGQIVDNQTVIGREGCTGAGSGGIVHLHFELKQTDELGLFGKVNPGNLDNYYYNPRQVLENEEFSLLPLWCWNCSRCHE